MIQILDSNTSCLTPLEPADTATGQGRILGIGLYGRVVVSNVKYWLLT